MKLELQDILHKPDGVLEFSTTLDLSDLSFYGEQPITGPVLVEGCVTNHAGALVLEGQISSKLDLQCHRCICAYQAEKTVELHSLLATELEDEEHDEIILLDGTTLDIEELATSAFVLALDTKNLCTEDCKGLCPICGTDLNRSACSCSDIGDSPFAALAHLRLD
ncbi:MAG: DUF177 domain-containing protein [Eubacteriales bacterium]